MLTREEVAKRLGNARAQRDEHLAQANACEGAMAAFQEVLTLMDAPPEVPVEPPPATGESA